MTTGTGIKSRATAWWAIARANPLFRVALAVAVLVILLDQASKLWVLHGIDLDQKKEIPVSGFFQLSFKLNTGVSFGLFQGGLFPRVFFSVFAIAVSAGVAVWAGQLDRRVASLGAGMVIGGALGNAIDRIMYGGVVDFLDFSGLGFPWTFNLADTAINIGVACFLYDAFFAAPKADSAGVNKAPSD